MSTILEEYTKDLTCPRCVEETEFIVQVIDVDDNKKFIEVVGQCTLCGLMLEEGGAHNY